MFTSLYNYFGINSTVSKGTGNYNIPVNIYFRDTNFSIVEDTQLLLTERKDGVYAYVSYL